MNWNDVVLHLDYGLGLPLAGRLPRNLAYRLADRRGRWMAKRLRDSRRAAAENLAQVFPDLSPQEVEELVERHFRMRSRDELESFWYRRPLSFFEEFVEVSGLDLLRQAAASGRGVLLFSGHQGCTGLFFVVMGRHGIRLNIVGRSLDPEENPLHPAFCRYARKRVANVEEAVGAPFLLTGRGNYPKMLEMLRRGEILMMLIDVVPTLLKRTVPVQFLGRRTEFGTGLAQLYKATGARLLLWTIHQDLDTNQYHIEIEDVGAGIKRTDPPSRIMPMLASMIDEKIRRHPAEWNQWDSLSLFVEKPESKPMSELHS